VAAYIPGADLSVGRLASIDRRGTVDYLDVPERVYGAIELAPDGSRLAVQVVDVNDYIWIWDIPRREGRRVAHPTAEGYPRWSRDGRRIAGGTASRAGIPSIFVHDVEPTGGVGAGRTLENVTGRLRSWSPRGDALAIGLPSFDIQFVS
jgi:Tol biopolymer transport system component